jgi:hypothetical protein
VDYPTLIPGATEDDPNAVLGNGRLIRPNQKGPGENDEGCVANVHLKNPAIFSVWLELMLGNCV